MSERQFVDAIVLSSTPMGEFDRRLVLLTGEYGRMSAFAKGARRPKSSLVAATNPFVTATFEVYEGREAFTVYSANVSDYFSELSGDLDKVWYGYYFLELADYFSLQNNDERERMVLLYKALKALEQDRLNPVLIRVIYEFKNLVLYGEYPSEFEKYHISEVTQYALWYMIKTPCAKVFSFDLADDVLFEVERLTRQWYDRYIGHEFKSQSFLDL